MKPRKFYSYPKRGEKMKERKKYISKLGDAVQINSCLYLT